MHSTLTKGGGYTSTRKLAPSEVYSMDVSLGDDDALDAPLDRIRSNRNRMRLGVDENFERFMRLWRRLSKQVVTRRMTRS